MSSTNSSLPHLERDLEIVRRYTFVYSNAPFVSHVPVIGTVIVALKNLARRALRAFAGAGLGSQAEFNAAVAEILFEFTRRAATPDPLVLSESTLNELAHLDGSAPASNRTVAALAREILLLREQMRAAQLTAADNERALAEIRRLLAERER